jgi:DNA-binding transcriptional ArsR family regulator
MVRACNTISPTAAKMGRGMTEGINDIDDPRLVKALAHPTRVRILGLLEHRTLSPKLLAGELDQPVVNVNYHVHALHRFGFIKLVRERQVRGAVEHYYELVAPPRITAKAWTQLPDIVKEAMIGAALAQTTDIVHRAVNQDGFARPESQHQRVPYSLDERAFNEASAIFSDALERIEKLEREARKRIDAGTSEPVPAIAVIMLFDAPPEGAGAEDAPSEPVATHAPRRRTALDA